MSELNDRIALLEMRFEQLLIHLRSIDRNCADARLRRADVYAILRELVRLKGKRERMLAALELAEAA